ncbi:MAG: hypothetical protein E7062_09735 [Spirochaetaceae bacterium]|nr:hypothetical protein [Spirochaetaceae bacterium]
MKTIFLNCSPKKKFSASSYFIFLQKLFIKGKKISLNLNSPYDYEKILSSIENQDNLIFVLPLYVDALPSHVLPFLKKLEKLCKEKNLSLHVNTIINNGFIEGSQNKTALEIFENFCIRSNITWQGGIGIGGGVMLNVTRILFIVNLIFFVVNIIVNAINSNIYIFPNLLFDFLKIVFLLLFLNCGVLWYLMKMGFAINKKRFFGEKFTRIMLPSFVFIIFTNIFFTIISIIKGGFFKKWLKS